MQIRVELRKSGLEAVAVLEAGPFEPEAAAAAVLEQLATLGVSSLPPADQVRAALASLGEDNPPADGVVVARGVPPQQGIGAQVLPLFPVRATPPQEGVDPLAAYARNVVYPGDCILQRTPPSPGIAGRSLLGVELPGQSGTDIQIIPGPGVHASEDERRYTATTYGVALFHNRRLQVADAVTVSDDVMAVDMTVLPDPRLDEGAQVARLVASLGALEVRNGVDAEVLAAAVKQAREHNAPVTGVPVARGKLPVDGREIDYELVVDAQQKVGKELEGGRIDFRESESIKNVTRGEPLARVIPAVEPQPGYRVNGEMLRPKMRRATGLKPGENTSLSEDGTAVVADGDGMLVLQGGKFHVADQYLINGDVDYASGNVRASGSVTIRGNVRAGFEVEAGKDVEIFGDVEEAKVSTAADLVVKGGITGGSELRVGQDCRARYIQSSRVEVGGNLAVQLAIANCQVYVGGELTATGSQGAIVGGEINAALGIEAREVGSPSAKTHVAVGVDLRVIRELEEIDAERGGLQTTLQQLQANLGRAFLKDPRAALAAIPATLRKPKLEMLQKMQELYQRDKELAARHAELQQINAEMRLAQIKVLGEIHAGTVITISRLRHVLQESLRRVVLYYDADGNQVAWKRL